MNNDSRSSFYSPVDVLPGAVGSKNICRDVPTHDIDCATSLDIPLTKCKGCNIGEPNDPHRQETPVARLKHGFTSSSIDRARLSCNASARQYLMNRSATV